MGRKRLDGLVALLLIVAIGGAGVVMYQLVAPVRSMGPDSTATVRLVCIAPAETVCQARAGAQLVLTDATCTVMQSLQVYAPRSALVLCTKSSRTACLVGAEDQFLQDADHPTSLQVVTVTTRCQPAVPSDPRGRWAALGLFGIGAALLWVARRGGGASRPSAVPTTPLVLVVPGSGRGERPIAPAPRRWRTSAILVLATTVIVVGAGVPLAAATVDAGGFTASSAAQWYRVIFAEVTNTPAPTATPLPPIPPSPLPHASGVHDFLCVALPYARQAQAQITSGPQAQPHPWYLSVILAQWGVEQGWVVPGYTGYNWGNVSAIPGVPTVGGTNQPGSPVAFAYAPTPDDGVRDYVTFVQNGLYDAVAAAYPQGPEAQAQALGQSPWDAGHYAPDGTYSGYLLVTTIQQNQLTRFDRGAGC